MENINFKDVELFSMDGETYYDDDQHILDHCEEYVEVGEEFEFQIGKKREFKHSDFLHPCQLDNLVESMQERAYDEVGEVAEIYLEHLSNPEVEKEFEKLVSDFIQRKVGDPNVFGVTGIQTIKAIWDGDSYSQVL